MNPEIHKIVENMKHPSEFHQTPDTRQNYLSVQMAQLLVLLAEETEIQGQKIAGFTRWLIWFTIVLIFVGAIQIIVMLVKP